MIPASHETSLKHASTIQCVDLWPQVEIPRAGCMHLTLTDGMCVLVGGIPPRCGRLGRGEHERIMAVLDAGVLPRKQRPLQLEHVPALGCLYLLATETAMRLSEMYTLTLDQVALDRRTVFLDRTKNGSKRQVPLSTVAVAALQDYLALRQAPPGQPEGMLFPWWDGDHAVRARHRVTDFLSKLWVGIFAAAGCEGLKFHDLRHEATIRLFERTRLTELEIMKITGHKDIRMLARYANLRGFVLSERLW